MLHEIAEVVGDLLGEVVQELTQMKLAKLADLNIRTIQKIEAGETNILITTASRLQRAIGCPWDRLMG